MEVAPFPKERDTQFVERTYFKRDYLLINNKDIESQPSTRGRCPPHTRQDRVGSYFARKTHDFLRDHRIVPLEHCEPDALPVREAYWIRTLHTLTPHGLNSA